MIPIPQNTAPYAVLILAEQVMVPKEIVCPFCGGKKEVMISCCTSEIVDEDIAICPKCKEHLGHEDCPDCKGSGKIDSETDKVPKQPLTETDLAEFYRKQKELLAEYGFAVDGYGLKESMIKRLTEPKIENEYDSKV